VIAISLILVAAAILTYRIFNATGSQRLDQSSFYDLVAAGQVKTITIVPDGIGFDIRGTLDSEAAYSDDRVGEGLSVFPEPGLRTA
jgi:hypothetical protein